MKVERVPAIAAVVTLAVHLLGNAHYGFFRDELYFIVCGWHPAWGYVDIPPIVPLLAAGSQLFGHSLFLLRAVPALFAAAGAYATCLVVIELGGGVFAEVVGSIAYIFAPVLMNFGMKVGPDMVGLWLWPLAALYILRIAKGDDPRLWLATGAVVGLSIESKYSVLFFVVALVTGLLLTPQRRVLFTRWCAAGALLAAAIALPNFIWQASHAFPMLELLRNGQSGKNTVVSPLFYLFQQLLLTNVLLAPVWIIGLVWLLRDGAARFLGYAYLVLIALMIVAHGKHYYPADIYPIVMAAGGVAIEQFTHHLNAVRTALVAAMIAAGVVFVPFAMPVLREQQTLAYTQWIYQTLHLSRSAMQTEHGRTAALPEDWADMHGWPELASTVARIYNGLPPGQRAQATIVASNYGEAAAIDFFGPQYGLPGVISGHNNYWLWGTHGYTGNVIIDISGDCGASRHLFRTSRLAARFNPPWVISYEQDIPIMVCTGIKQPLAKLWPSIKNFI